MFSISFTKHCNEKMENNLLSIITSTAHACFVSALSYRNMIFNQLAHIFLELYSNKHFSSVAV